jgi:hypothetical protein
LGTENPSKEEVLRCGVVCVSYCIRQADEPAVERDWEPKIPQKKKFSTATLELGTATSKCKPKLKYWGDVGMVSSGKLSRKDVDP